MDKDKATVCTSILQGRVPIRYPNIRAKDVNAVIGLFDLLIDLIG